MASTSKGLGEELRAHHDELVDRWYRAWRDSSHPSPELGEKGLKNWLSGQLRIVGEQILDLDNAEPPDQLWKVYDRLDPEHRVTQQMPIEQVIEEYAIAVDVVRAWIEERDIQVPFAEYSYFYQAMFELAAESARRYAAHEADQVRAARAEYLASVMHQLRSPLSALSMQVELLEGEADVVPTVVSRLDRNIRRIRSMVEVILRLERFEPRELPVQPEEVRPAQLVNEMIEDLSEAAARKEVSLTADVDDDIHMRIDTALFLDALENLVQNAVKFTEEGFVRIEAEEHDDAVLFRVRDSGPGIAPSKLRTLLRHTQRGAGGGVGLGLKIAYQAALAQGGSIDIESEVGKGSVFTLCMPKEIVPREEGEADPPQADSPCDDS